MEWSEGGEWDNCNSIINKYIFLKKPEAAVGFGEVQRLRGYCNQKGSMETNLEELVPDEGGFVGQVKECKC